MADYVVCEIDCTTGTAVYRPAEDDEITALDAVTQEAADRDAAEVAAQQQRQEAIAAVQASADPALASALLTLLGQQ